MPTLQIRTDGKDRWTVRARWQDGSFEDVGGFRSEQEADHWITNTFPVWLEELESARNA